MNAPLLEVNDLKKHFPLRGAVVYAVDGVSFHVDKGETLALVGESGCGKSTVGRAILRLFDITAGQVVLDGRRIDSLSAHALRPLRRRVQVVFQDPFSSLNPRMRVRDILAEAERDHILTALRESNWVVGGARGAAARLGVKRTTLISKMRKRGLSKAMTYGG